MGRSLALKSPNLSGLVVCTLAMLAVQGLFLAPAALGLATDPPEIISWSSAAVHGHGIGEALLEIPDDDSFSEPRCTGITSLIVQFNKAMDPVVFTPDKVQICGMDVLNQPVDLSGVTIGTYLREDETVGVIDLSPALPDVARYLVRITGPKDAAGNLLTGDRERIMTALMGDASGDLRVNVTDLARVRAHRSSLIDVNDANQVRADITCDGRVNVTDLSRVRSRRGNDARNISNPVLDPGTHFEQDGMVAFEAEDYDENLAHGSHSWVAVTAPAGYSGASAMRAMPDVGTRIDTGYVTGSPQMDYRVYFQTPGTWYVWLHAYAYTENDDDTCHVGLNGEAVPSADRIGDIPEAQWTWYNDTRDAARATLEIPYVGLHTINVWMREDGFVLDRVILTTDPDYTQEDPTPSHPTVLFDADDIPLMQQRVSVGMGPVIMGHMLQKAQQGKIVATGMYSLITDDLTYVQTGISSLISKANQSPTSSWLGNGSQLYEVAMGYDLLHRYMTPEQRETVRNRLEYLAQNVHNHGYSHSSGNWLPHVWGALTFAGFAMKDESANAEAWILHGREAHLMYLDHTFDPEGADYEALCRYLNMGMDKTIQMMVAERRRGQDYAGYRDNLLNKLTEFATYMRVPYLHHSGRPIDWKFMWIPYDDSFNVSSDPISLWAAIAGLTGDTLAQWIFETSAVTTSKPCVSNPVIAALLYDPNVPAEEPASRLPLARAYWGIDGNDEGQWSSGHVFMRTDFEDKESVIFSAQCGDTGGWHGHADQSSIFLYAYGDRLVMDWAIVGSYGQPLCEWMKGPEAQNIVLIDGQATPDYTVGDNLNWPIEYLHGGDVDGFIHSEHMDFVSMDFVEGLELNPQIGSADRAKRYAVFFRLPDRQAYVVMVDDVIKDDALHNYEWLLQPDDKHIIVKEGTGQFAFNGDPPSEPGPGGEYSGLVDLKIRIIEPQDAQHTTATFLGYMVDYLRLSSQQDRQRGLFFNVLYPVKQQGMTMPNITEIRQGTVIGAQIGEDMVLFNQDPSAGPINAAGVETDGELVAIRISAGQVLKAIVRDGTYLRLNGQDIPFEVPGPRVLP